MVPEISIIWFLCLPPVTDGYLPKQEFEQCYSCRGKLIRSDMVERFHTISPFSFVDRNRCRLFGSSCEVSSVTVSAHCCVFKQGTAICTSVVITLPCFCVFGSESIWRAFHVSARSLFHCDSPAVLNTLKHTHTLPHTQCTNTFTDGERRIWQQQQWWGWSWQS